MRTSQTKMTPTLKINLLLDGKVFINSRGNYVKLHKYTNFVGLRSEIQFEACEEKTLELVLSADPKSAKIVFASDVKRYIKQNKWIEQVIN